MTRRLHEIVLDTGLSPTSEEGTCLIRQAQPDQRQRMSSKFACVSRDLGPKPGFPKQRLLSR